MQSIATGAPSDTFGASLLALRSFDAGPARSYPGVPTRITVVIIAAHPSALGPRPRWHPSRSPIYLRDSGGIHSSSRMRSKFFASSAVSKTIHAISHSRIHAFTGSTCAAVKRVGLTLVMLVSAIPK